MIPLGICGGAEVLTIADAFNRADAASLGTTDTGQAWIFVQGTGGISSNQAFGKGPYVCDVNFGSRDQRVTFKLVTVGAGIYPGLRARITASNGYQFQRDPNGTGFVYRISPGARIIQGIPVVAGDKISLSVKETGSGTQLNAYVNDVLKASYLDTNASRPVTGTYAGIILGNLIDSYGDNFRVEPV